MKNVIALVLIGIVLVGSGCISGNPPVATATPTPVITPSPAASATPVPADSSGLKRFSSWNQVVSLLKATGSGRYGGGIYRGMMVDSALSAPAGAPSAKSSAEQSVSGASNDYSTTNVQVAGVDEEDIMKNDGTYIYTVTNGKIVIVKAYPAAEAGVASVINDSNASFQGIFINGDKLVAFGYNYGFDWQPIIVPLEKQFNATGAGEAGSQGGAGVIGGVVDAVGKIAAAVVPGFMPPYPRYYPRESAFIRVYDVSDRTNPVLVKTLDIKGSYFASRMIGNKVYAVFNDQADYAVPRPLYAVDGAVRDVAPADIGYFDYPAESYQFTTVLGIDLGDLAKPESRKIVMMGYGQDIYVSSENAYVVFTKYAYQSYQPIWAAYRDVVEPLFTQDYKDKLAAVDAADVPEWAKDNLRISVATEFISTIDSRNQSQWLYDQVAKREEELRGKEKVPSELTVIHKFSLGDAITYAGKGEVPGHVLNQFSMDEAGGNFRIATTVGEVFRNANQGVTPATNNVYVLDPGLKVIGTLEGLAPGEKIYSARFIGDRAYLVTFKKVDPLFVIGLSDPANPQVLGKLKLPGYSEYLHPYDETHLIGLGKDAVPAKNGDGGDADFAWYQGVKLSLFDVSDVSAPKEVASFKIGDRGTDSYALQDHKAFLFSLSKGLLVIPIRLAEINPAKYPQGVEPQTYGDFTFQGAYVFNVSLDGFALRGTVSHVDNGTLAKMGDYYWSGGTDVKRSAYINDVLYTVSDKFVKANDLSSLGALASVELPFDQQQYGYYGRAMPV